MRDKIIIHGAKENNLKNISLELPRNKFIVFTGLSGSGKTSLAFDTLFAEGQRRYMESLSSYARQFLGQMKKPDVDSIEGLSPAIAIDQKTTSVNPRSTVGTITEIHDYLRLLFSHIGTPYCPYCNKEIQSLSVDAIVEKILAKPNMKILIIAPVIRGKKGEHKKLIESFLKSGYVRIKIDKIVYSITEIPELERNQKHDISVVVDRLISREDNRSRIAESVENALRISGGLVVIDFEGEEITFSSNFSCPDCGFAFDEIAPRLFSFNTPYGACLECSGLGYKKEISVDKLIPDRTKSIAEGAIHGWGWGDGAMSNMYYKALARKYNFSLNTPIIKLPPNILDILLFGTKGEKIELKFHSSSFKTEYMGQFEGIIPNLLRRYKETTSEFAKSEIEKLMIERRCPECNGTRYNKKALSVKISGLNIAEVSDLTILELKNWIENLNLSKLQLKIGNSIIKEILSRVKFLFDVGLGYLTLSRSANTLSGGEAQRIRLATQIGSALTGVLYILDEPSIGLHPRDTKKLIKTLKSLRDQGNTVIVVEHDEDTIKAADYIVDVGPKAGVHGGEIVVAGTLNDVVTCEKSITGAYISGKRKIQVPSKRRNTNNNWLNIYGCKENNLKNIDVSIPLGVFCVITGVSGSGKSTLINGIVGPAVANILNGTNNIVGEYKKIEGVEYLDKIVEIDQAPIGRTPRSNPATYTGVFTFIRELFASTPEAKAKGFNAGRFSFNVKGGRCETCGGDGVHKIEMHFLPDVYVECEECKGKRYNHETLEIKYKGASIADVLDMTVEKSLKFFENHSKIKNKIQALYDVGLGYIKLGQPATTLSGGEAQRVKLATELAKKATGKTLYLLDEPTTGLHSYDVEKLISILQRLVSSGNSVVVIEHNLDVISCADYCIDLGPEGGENGGLIVAQGTPEQIAKENSSETGKILAKLYQI